jgi:hypothetical protein
VYDEHHSGFSSIYLTPAVTDLILADPEMFSSFYHLPSRHISRETYLFIAELTGYLEHFIPTLSMIRDYLAGDVPGFDILSYIEACMPEYRAGDAMVLPGLYFISDKLKAYLESVADKGLPSAAWDVFLLDMTRAFNISKYRRWQLLQAGTPEPGIDKLEPGVNYRIVKRPYWSIFHSGHYIYDFISKPASERDRTSLRKGRYHYLVVPVSHRLANIFKIPLKELPFYDLEEVSFLEDIVRQNRHNLSEDRILQIIRRMKSRGLIDIYEIPGSDTSSSVHDEPARQPAGY